MSTAKESASSAAGDNEATETTNRSEQKLDHLLLSAASLMAEHGFAQTSIRNVAQKTGYSLAGMYYYFENKEDLLYQIQHRTFAALLAEQEEVAAVGGEATDRLRRLIDNHLTYFTNHAAELKVCTFELQSLQGERYTTIEKLRRRYFRCVADVIGDILGVADGDASGEKVVRHYALFVFGMLNWIFMWYEPQRDGPVEDLGEQMMAMVMHGLKGGLPPSP